MTWRAEIAAEPAERLLVLDETSTQTVMTRRSGRAPRGQRVVGRVPRNHGPNVTCLMAITPTAIQAPCVFEGALDGSLFARWVDDWLVPILQPGTIVILDNLRVHRHPGVQAAIEAAGCHLRFLPPYSPDFNPIELIFAKLKTHLRGAEARAFEPLVEETKRGLATITPSDVSACYRHCGYLPSTAMRQSP